MSILVSRDIGTHGATIFLEREGIEMDSSLKSDCTSLFPTVKKLLDENIEIVAMRDATRGGVSAVLNEWSSSSSVTIEIEEEQVPIADEVQGACEMLGFEAYNLANEGTFILAVPKYEEQRALEILKGENPSANIIGTVTMEFPKKVLLKSSWGTKRFLELPTGELLPRIC
jgi:hydrogenase expression/formation protein HypE